MGMYVCMHVCIDAWVCTCVYIYGCMGVWVRMYVCVCMCVYNGCMSVCLHVCVRVCICVCTCMCLRKDGGRTFPKHTLLNVSNSLGPHYVGGSLNHGIELMNGPHKGRLVLAGRCDHGGGVCTCMYVCLYVCMYVVCMYVCMCVCVCIYVHGYMSVCIYAYVRVCMYVLVSE